MSIGDVGEVDLFGLDEFGQPAGLNPVWGAVGGSILGTGVAIAARQMTADPTSFVVRHSEAVGAGVAIAAGGIMAAFPGTRAAGWTAMATGLFTNGLRALENMIVQAKAMHGWGEVRIEPTRAFQGLGMVSAEQRTALSGLNGPLPTLVGNSLSAPAKQVQILGGPAISGLGSHYGATIFGGGN